MRIALVLSAPPAYSETFFNNKINILRDAGFKVDVFTNAKGPSKVEYTAGFSSGKGFVKDILSLIKALCRIGLSPIVAIRLFRLNKKSGFGFKRNIRSLLICAHLMRSKHDWVAFGFATLALDRENLALAKGARLSTSIRGYDIAVYPLKHPGCYDLLWQRLSKLHYISDDLLKVALTQGFIEETPHQKITPAIDTDFFSPDIISEQKDSNRNKVRFATVARLHWKKGLVDTLIALSQLKSNGIDFEYKIIGIGDERERILYAAQEMGLSEMIVLPGKLDREQIKNVLNDTDIYLQYSIQEGFCNSLLEAQSMGLLCIASNAEGLSENVLDGKTGWIVPKLQPKTLAKTIMKVIQLPEEEKIKIRTAASERVRVEFNLDLQRDQFVKFYSS